MGELFNITHDAGNLDEYDSTVIDGGDLSAHADAAIGGSHGLKCVVDDTTDIYGQVTQTWPVSNQIRYRLYFNANDFNGNDYDQMTLIQGDWCATANFSGAALQKRSTWVRLRLYGGHDAGSDSYFVDPLAAGEHYIEVHVERASTDISSDGRIRWWLDGALVKTWDNVDNYDHCSYLDYLQVGAMSIGAGVSGTVYLDEFQANDDGSEIGEIPAVVDGIRNMAMGMRVVMGLS